MDLENEAVIEKETQKEKEEQEEDEMQQVSKHPLMVSKTSFCENHALFLLFAEEGLPQVLSDELLLLIMQLFKLSGN